MYACVELAICYTSHVCLLTVMFKCPDTNVHQLSHFQLKFNSG